MEEIEKKLEELRERWKNEPANRKIIELQAKTLKMGMEAEKDIVEEARKIFE